MRIILDFLLFLSGAEEKIEFEYDTFTMFLRQQLFPDSVLDSSHWLLSEMEFGDAKEAVRHKLSLLLKDYILFSKPISLIKSAIISGCTEIEFRKDENSILQTNSTWYHPGDRASIE